MYNVLYYITFIIILNTTLTFFILKVKYVHQNIYFKTFKKLYIKNNTQLLLLK